MERNSEDTFCEFLDRPRLETKQILQQSEIPINQLKQIAAFNDTSGSVSVANCGQDLLRSLFSHCILIVLDAPFLFSFSVNHRHICFMFLYDTYILQVISPDYEAVVQCVIRFIL